MTTELVAEITSVSKKGYYAKIGKETHFCIINNSFTGGEDRPVVGDKVQLQHRDSQYLITSIQPRKNYLARYDHDRERYQGFASNLDTIFVVTGANKEFSPTRIRRFLLLSGGQDIRKVIVLTKVDLLSKKELAEFTKTLEKEFPMVEHVCINALDKVAVESLLGFVRKKGSMILLGSSGVGKSTITNTLCGLELKTSETLKGGRFADKGKHTTSSRNMYYTKSGHKIIDVPGIKIVGVEHSTVLESEIFEKIRELAKQCKFTNCRHDTEPSCAVKLAIESGELDEIEFENYLEIIATCL